MMTILHVQLFGRFQICSGENSPISLEARKAQELFAYLLLYRHRPHTRESLTNILWEDTSTTQAKKYFRQTLWQLQAALPEYAEPILLIESDWIQVNPDAGLELDVDILEQASALVQGSHGRDLTPEQEQRLHEATRLYHSDLLQGWYQDWCLFERERLQLTYLALLDKLLGCCETHYKYDAGLVYGMDILRCDRTRERTHRRLMRLHYLAGDRAAAIRQYQSCVEALAEELDVKPSKRTVALHDEIRADRVTDLTDRPTTSASNPPPHSALDEILARLIEMQRSVEAIKAVLTDS